MKILFLVDGHVLRMGGAELQAFSLANQLISMGHEVEVVAPYLDREMPQITERNGVKVRQLNFPRIPKLSSFFYLLRFAWYLRQEGRQYDAIHIHMVHKMAAVTGLLRKYAPCPVVAKVSGAYEFQDGEQSSISRFGSFQYWHYKMVAKLDYFQSISSDTSARLKAAGIETGKILDIPNGVDITRFTSSKALHVGEADNKTVIVFNGRLVSVKSIHTLVEAAAILQQKYPNRFELRLFGDGPLRDELMQQVARLGLVSTVIFRGQTDNVAEALQGAHIYSQVSSYEGLSNAVLEAMGSGLPLVLSAVGGNTDVVEHGKNGLLVQPGDSASLADSLGTLIEDRKLCQLMGENSRKKAETSYSMRSVANSLLPLYQGPFQKKNSALNRKRSLAFGE